MDKKMRIIMIAVAIVGLLLGASLIIWPEQSRQVICYVLGGLIVGYGIFSVISYFLNNEANNMGFGLAIGAACVLIGTFLLIRAETVLQALEMIIGVAVIICAVIRLQTAVNIRRISGSFSKAMLICALVAMALGTLLLFNPFTVLQTATIVSGAVLVIDAVLTIWSMIQMGIVQGKANKSNPAATI